MESHIPFDKSRKEIPEPGEIAPETAGGRTIITDSEFGALQPADGGFQLELQLDCPPDGEQSLLVFLDGTEDPIDSVQRGILQDIFQQWPEIWPSARKAWFRENPKDKQSNPTARREWILEAEIASQKIIETEFEGDPIWRLSVSSGARGSMLVFMLEGPEILDEELM